MSEITNTATKETTALERFCTELLKHLVQQQRLKTLTDLDSLCELAVELGK